MSGEGDERKRGTKRSLTQRSADMEETHATKHATNDQDKQKSQMNVMMAKIEATLMGNRDALLEVYLDCVNHVYAKKEQLNKVERPEDWLKPTRVEWRLLGQEDRREQLKEVMPTDDFGEMSKADHKKSAAEQKHENNLLAFAVHEEPGSCHPTMHREKLKSWTKKESAKFDRVKNVPIGPKGKIMWGKDFGHFSLVVGADGSVTLQQTNGPSCSLPQGLANAGEGEWSVEENHNYFAAYVKRGSFDKNILAIYKMQSVSPKPPTKRKKSEQEGMTSAAGPSGSNDAPPSTGGGALD
jgi:hypothetical protein